MAHYPSPLRPLHITVMPGGAGTRPTALDSWIAERHRVQRGSGPANYTTRRSAKQRRPCDGVSCGLATCFLVRKFDVRYFLLNLLDYVFDSDPFTRTRPDGRSN